MVVAKELLCGIVCIHMGERLNSCGGWVPNVVASRYGYAPSVAMVHIYILSHGNMHQAIRASHGGDQALQIGGSSLSPSICYVHGLALPRDV